MDTTTVVIILTAIQTLIIAICIQARKSRVKRLQCCGVEVDRDIEQGEPATDAQIPPATPYVIARSGVSVPQSIIASVTAPAGVTLAIMPSQAAPV